MSKIWRQAIVPIASIAGVQVVNLLLNSSHPVHSFSSPDCPYGTSQVQPTTVVPADAAPTRDQPKTVAIDDNFLPNGLTDEENQIRRPRQPQAPVEAALLPEGMSEAEYQAQRDSLRADRSMVLGGY